MTWCQKMSRTISSRVANNLPFERCDTIQLMENYTYRIILEPDEGGYHAYVPALRGCHTWGKTITEARMMVRDAIDVYLRSLIADGQSIPTDSGFEIFETVRAPKWKPFSAKATKGARALAHA